MTNQMFTRLVHDVIKLLAKPLSIAQKFIHLAKTPQTLQTIAGGSFNSCLYLGVN
ncbi:MAG: hypothetical protein ACI8WB_005907 [Phenylobacterium sp.]|jgi:hypothetical protein